MNSQWVCCIYIIIFRLFVHCCDELFAVMISLCGWSTRLVIALEMIPYTFVLVYSIAVTYCTFVLCSCSWQSEFDTSFGCVPYTAAFVFDNQTPHMLLSFCIACIAEDAVCCYSCSLVCMSVSVFVSVDHIGEPCRSGRTDRDSIWTHGLVWAKVTMC